MIAGRVVAGEEENVGRAGVGPHVDLTMLMERLEDIRSAPTDGGTVELIVRRPAVEEREILEEGLLDVRCGLVGDTWPVRAPPGMEGPDPEAQLTIMNARVASAIGGDREVWSLAGDQLYVDLDISQRNLPAGARLQIGSALVEISATPHTGCTKFSARFGRDALRFVMSPAGRELRLRGANCRVITSGAVRTGDWIRKIPR